MTRTTSAHTTTISNVAATPRGAVARQKVIAVRGSPFCSSSGPSARVAGVDGGSSRRTSRTATARAGTSGSAQASTTAADGWAARQAATAATATATGRVTGRNTCCTVVNVRSDPRPRAAPLSSTTESVESTRNGDSTRSEVAIAPAVSGGNSRSAIGAANRKAISATAAAAASTGRTA